MAKPKTNRGALVTIDVIKGKCKDCDKEYEANKMVYEKGEVITPLRCKPCQTAYLTNLRVNHTIKQIQLLGNLKARLSPEERVAVISAVKSEIETLMDRYAGSTNIVSAFDLKAVSA